MLGSDDDQGRIVQPCAFNSLTNAAIEASTNLNSSASAALGVPAASRYPPRHAIALLDQLLAHADGLEVHAEDGRNLRRLSAEVVLAIDLVEDRIHLQRVVALNVLEAVGPRGQVRTGIANGGTGNAGRSRDAGKTDYVGVDFRSIEIVERGRADAGSDRRVRGVLVRPRRVSASL